MFECIADILKLEKLVVHCWLLPINYIHSKWIWRKKEHLHYFCIAKFSFPFDGRKSLILAKFYSSYPFYSTSMLFQLLCKMRTQSSKQWMMKIQLSDFVKLAWKWMLFKHFDASRYFMLVLWHQKLRQIQTVSCPFAQSLIIDRFLNYFWFFLILGYGKLLDISWSLNYLLCWPFWRMWKEVRPIPFWWLYISILSNSMYKLFYATCQVSD